jgi:LytS/YehU family sensor histidine kinase
MDVESQTVCIGLVDLCVLGKLSVGLQVSCLVGSVLEDNVSLLVLVVTQGEKNNISLVDPDLLPELSTDVCQPLLAVEAHSLKTTVTKHLNDLGVFCTSRS